MGTITKPVPVRIPAGMLARVDQLHVPVPCKAYVWWLLDRALTAEDKAQAQERKASRR